MRRGSKIVLGIACASIGIGIIIIMLSYAIGSGKQRNSEYTTYVEEVFGVESLHLDIKYGKVTIVEGDRFRIDAENILENGIKSYTEGSTWYIKEQYSDENSFNFFGWRVPFTFQFFGFGNEYYPQIIITIPSDLMADQVTIDLGAGEIKIEELNTRIADFEIGAGSLNVRSLSVSDKLNAEVGAGELSIKRLIAKDAVLDCGVGSIDLAGEILGDLDADCGVGQIVLDLEGKEEDYNYNISCGIGEIKLNDKRFEFSADEIIRNDNTIGTFNLNCSVGSLTVNIR